MNALRTVVQDLIGDTDRFGTTYALIVDQRDETLVEQYGGEVPHFDRPPEPVGPDTTLLSWSMAKSILHAVVGLLVSDGLLALDEPAPVPAWHADPADPRGAITLEHLLTMRDGLDFTEDYVDAGISDVIEMLFGSGKDDVAAYAAARPLRYEPGTHFNYSSGTSNIVAGIAGRAVGGGDALREFMRARLFDPIGMRSARPRFDAAGTFIGSSYVFATARDFVRFGQLYLHDGVHAGRRILPEGWVAHGRRLRSNDEKGNGYGAHWWVVDDDTFRASGYEGQRIWVTPDLDLVVVRMGRSTTEQGDELRHWYDALIAAMR